MPDDTFQVLMLIYDETRFDWSDLEDKGRIHVFSRLFRAIFEFCVGVGYDVTLPSRHKKKDRDGNVTSSRSFFFWSSRNCVTSDTSFFFWSIKILFKTATRHPALHSILAQYNLACCSSCSICSLLCFMCGSIKDQNHS